MPKRTRTSVEREHTTRYIVYDRRTGRVLALHDVTALPGVRAPSDELVKRRVLACAAEALGRRPGELRVLIAAEAPPLSPALRVDISTGALRTDPPPAPRDEEGPGRRTAVAAKAQFSSP